MDTLIRERGNTEKGRREEGKITIRMFEKVIRDHKY